MRRPARPIGTKAPPQGGIRSSGKPIKIVEYTHAWHGDGAGRAVARAGAVAARRLGTCESTARDAGRARYLNSVSSEIDADSMPGGSVVIQIR